LGSESASREDLLVLVGMLQRQNEELAAANECLDKRMSG
jgi:transposase